MQRLDTVSPSSWRGGRVGVVDVIIARFAIPRDETDFFLRRLGWKLTEAAREWTKPRCRSGFHHFIKLELDWNYGFLRFLFIQVSFLSFFPWASYLEPCNLSRGGGGGGGGMAVVVTSAQRLIRGEIDWIELINGRLIKFVFEREGKKCRSRC